MVHNAMINNTRCQEGYIYQVVSAYVPASSNVQVFHRTMISTCSSKTCSCVRAIISDFQQFRVVKVEERRFLLI